MVIAYGEAGQDSLPPLAERMRPHKIDDVQGQPDVVAPGSPLRLMAMKPDEATVAVPGAALLYGPPGTGKTTLSQIVAEQSGRHFMKLSAVDLETSDLTATIATISRLRKRNEECILFIDEVHQLSREQQDILLPVVEKRMFCFICATTEPPAACIAPALLSRCVVVHLHKLNADSIGKMIDRAVIDPRGLQGKVSLTPEARKLIVTSCGGDGRRALTTLEAAASRAVFSAGDDGEIAIVTPDDVRASVDNMPQYSLAERSNMSSALIKSMRGSDVNAAVYWTTRMLESGEDPKFVARKILLTASKDVGLAAPDTLRTAVAAAQAVDFLGMPDARMPLVQAAIAVALAPKSDAVFKATEAAVVDLRNGERGDVPEYLQVPTDDDEKKEGVGNGYLNPHDYGGVVRQNYMPEGMAEPDYYKPKSIGKEQHLIGWMQNNYQFFLETNEGAPNGNGYKPPVVESDDDEDDQTDETDETDIEEDDPTVDETDETSTQYDDEDDGGDYADDDADDGQYDDSQDYDSQGYDNGSYQQPYADPQQAQPVYGQQYAVPAQTGDMYA